VRGRRVGSDVQLRDAQEIGGLAEAQAAGHVDDARRGQPVPPGAEGAVLADPEPSLALAIERIRHALKRRLA
jgi:hypothetical protein